MKLDKSIIKGFSLLEILIALVVFAILAVITSTVLYNVFTIKDTSYSASKQLRQLQMALSIIKQDLIQAIEKPESIDLIHQKNALIGDENKITFTRGGIINPNFKDKRSSLQRVSYQLKNNHLYRYSWIRVDRPRKNIHQEQILLSHIKSFKIKYIDKQLKRLDNWQQKKLPYAVDLTFEHVNLGSFSQLFLLPQSLNYAIAKKK